MYNQILWVIFDILCFLIPTIAIHFIFIRPILRTRPQFSQFYSQEENFLKAIKVWLAGLKQRLTTWLIAIAGFGITMHDNIAPLIADSGVDVTKIVSFIPQDWW